MRLLTLAALALALLAGVSAAADEKGKAVELTGKLKTGIFAIGGETTGTLIETKEATYELDLTKDKEFAAVAEKLDGKTVTVKGTLVVKKGVEVKERKIVTVTEIKESK